jgi:16S rRNA (guanine966-N2)-methyltransferase
MRIIAGDKRGMRLQCPNTRDTRPITDRVKESLFHVLENYDLLRGARVADLFCGVGSLGLEALSRGASFVTFVEKNAAVLRALERNIAQLDGSARTRVVRASAFRVGAATPPGDAGRCDLVFVDPPYAATQQVGADSALAGLLRILEGQLAPNAVLVVRTREDVTLADRYGLLRVIERRRWGSMSVSLLQVESDER